MLRHDEESQSLDEDVPRITHNVGALILTLFCAIVGSASAVTFLMWLV